jgi:hypothetical protein
MKTTSKTAGHKKNAPRSRAEHEVISYVPAKFQKRTRSAGHRVSMFGVMV